MTASGVPTPDEAGGRDRVAGPHDGDGILDRNDLADAVRHLIASLSVPLLDGP